LEIFNFFRKFESNLKNELRGNSVNISKFLLTAEHHRLLATELPPPIIFTASMHGDTFLSPWRPRSGAGEAGGALSFYK